MSILLTGGAGYIGSHTAVELLLAGFDVVIADNYSNSSPRAIESVEKITGKSVRVYELDVSDAVSLEAVFKENKIEAVIHFAGLKSVGESVKVPLKYYRNNIDCTLSLLEVMEKFGVRDLVFSSSATVYGVPEALPLTEEMKTGPCSNPYGFTKLFIEQMIKDFAKAAPSVSAVLLRYFNPVGAHESGLIGENPKGEPNNLMPYISRVAAKRLERLRVFGNDYDTPDGTGVRDYIHVVDLARGHLAAMRHCRGAAGIHIFNLGTGEGYSVLDIVSAFEKANAQTVPYEISERREGDVASCYADPGKAKRILGWSAEKSLYDMCRDSWRFETLRSIEND